jgi:hypothetical protein
MMTALVTATPRQGPIQIELGGAYARSHGRRTYGELSTAEARQFVTVVGAVENISGAGFLQDHSSSLLLNNPYAEQS